MKLANIKHKEWIRGSGFLAAGIVLGALIFSSGGESPKRVAAHNEEHQHDTTISGENKGTTWTCSMHPQIRQDEPGKCPICGMDLIPAKETDGEEKPTELKMSEEALKLADIQTSTVQSKKPEKELRITGKIQVDERRVYTQSSHFPGRIEKLHIDFKGEYVKEGQPIARIYSSELISAQEELLEALKTKESNPQLVEAAREKLRQWKLSTEQITDIEKTREISEEMTIRANTDGIVHKKLVNEGDYIKKGMPLYHIANIRKVWVMFDAYQEDIPFIEEGDKVKFTVSSLPGETFESRVTFIDPLMNQKSQIARIRTEAVNKKGHLKPGMFATGRLISDNMGSGKELVVPESAVMWTGTRSVVFVKQPGRKQPTFRMREVLLGHSLGDSYIIKSGLSEKEEIVTYGTFVVDAAAQLAGKPSMMNRPEDKAPEESGKSHAEQEMQADQFESGRTSDPITWPESQSQTYKKLITYYLELKNKLVNGKDANSEAGKMLDNLNQIDMDAFSPKGHEQYMNYHKKIARSTRSIKNAETLQAQRNSFIQLSEAIIDMVQNFRNQESKLYVQFCPMANENQGAFWLSSEKQIRNPYYGKSMLTCGEVREELKGK